MRAHYLPILLAINFILAICVSYSISVGLGHLPAFLPYISDTGVLAPERSVFSQLINIAAFLHMTTVYIRFRHVNLEIKTRWNEPNFIGRKCHFSRINQWSLYLGYSVSIGLSLIGNFQLHSYRTTSADTSGPNKEEQIVQKIHWFGAFLTFIGGSVWMFIHSTISLLLSIRTKKGLWRRRTAFLRLCLTITCAILVVVGIGLAVTAAMHSEDTTGTMTWKDQAKTSDDDWRGTYSLSAILCEWIVTGLIVAFSLSMVPEFRQVSIQACEVTFRDSKVEESVRLARLELDTNGAPTTTTNPAPSSSSPTPSNAEVNEALMQS